mmetsp:Transcript_19758/g.30484  ORF Transcript_19758/g.30484 Transcript_19758/m.30484 type:complete len:779 (-) Transcript_19758:53-2389(-)|eukprot:CAMPEP_0195285762 /NCGR_PEP_ID=MMETSP0707-20130614/3483_1 /TAXON_ID=33640 /ORGANISM="Asterionellopsis glacialis, Strain CCMP134" /LENGTH=778 /DNA_ID=CAMNT_0040345309 /DNA_START=51 /DNA_END=2387 /DNA_ORIENTATION=+
MQAKQCRIALREVHRRASHSRILSVGISHVPALAGTNTSSPRLFSTSVDSSRYAFSSISKGLPGCILGPTTSSLREAIHRNNIFFQKACFSSAAEDEEATSVGQDMIVSRRSGVRNVAIVAHVDHGKTTLVDELLKAANKSIEGGSNENLDRLMDSGELEIERGITITSKVTRLDYDMGDNDRAIINVVDTPGHADFAGEVDRILSMVDGVCLVVDAAEGPMAQTKYVLSRALALDLKPIVVLNKADRDDALGRIESGETESQLLDLFDTLGASEEQMEYLTLYASARNGWVTDDMDLCFDIAKDGSVGDRDVGMKSLLDAILEHIPEPKVYCYDKEVTADSSHPASMFSKDKFSLAATSVGYDQYLGRTCTGRIYSGSIRVEDSVGVIKRDAEDNSGMGSASQLAGLFVNRGVSRAALEPAVAVAGDIVTLAGVPDYIAVGDTVTSPSDPVPVPIKTLPLAPPTLSMDFGANNGPLAGKEGSILTSSRIKDRLMKETDNNVTIVVEQSKHDAEKCIVYGRGELQLGILIEQMRREGYELIISPPKIVTKKCPDTQKELEPYEEVTVDVDAEHAGTVVNALTGARKGLLMEMVENSADGKTRLVFEVPSRGLLGFGPEIANDTRGTAVINHCFIEDRPHAGAMAIGYDKGKLVSSETGKTSLYALSMIAERGTLFIGQGEETYAGMVIGESSRPGDLEVNAVRSKQTSNIRTVNKDEKSYVPPPKRMTVEELIGYMNDDEVIEVTPQNVRLRKMELDAGARQRAARSRKKQQDAARKK